jgi:CheY-like chemotaxis protein
MTGVLSLGLIGAASMPGTVIIVDDDRDVASLVAEVLRDEGFDVVELSHMPPPAMYQAVVRFEPDVVLLDGGDAAGYGQSWTDAAWLRERPRPIAVIMFTAHTTDLREAELGESERSQRAAFVGFIAKPFQLEELVDIVKRAVERPSTVLRLV